MDHPETLARWVREFHQFYDALMKGREQFDAWFEEAALVEAEIRTETDEIRDCVAEIKKDRERHREIIGQLSTIKVAEFSPQELEGRSGRASKLLDLVGEITSMETYLPRKIDKLRFLLHHRTQ